MSFLHMNTTPHTKIEKIKTLLHDIPQAVRPEEVKEIIATIHKDVTILGMDRLWKIRDEDEYGD